MPDPVDRPDLLILPPVLYFGTLLLSMVLHFVRPIVLPIPVPWRWVGGFVALAGILFGGTGRAAFARSGTAANPLKPSSLIVESGPYAITRNPMYVGMAIAYLGVMVAGRLGWMLVFLLPVLALQHWGVILREERYLRRKFGAPYDDYRRRVRRYF